MLFFDLAEAKIKFHRFGNGQIDIGFSFFGGHHESQIHRSGLQNRQGWGSWGHLGSKMGQHRAKIGQPGPRSDNIVPRSAKIEKMAEIYIYIYDLANCVKYICLLCGFL